MRKKSNRSKGPPRIRLPLPAKSEKRHGDARKYDRRRAKERLRKDLSKSDPSE